MSVQYSIHPETKARYLDYLIEQLNTRLLEEPGRSGKPEDEIERAYWAQLIASLYRGLKDNERRAKVRH